ncbi:hypothetical protein ACFPRL_01130 [Pseudoclavibacter helvolus]
MRELRLELSLVAEGDHRCVLALVAESEGCALQRERVDLHPINLVLQCKIRTTSPGTPAPWGGEPNPWWRSPLSGSTQLRVAMRLTMDCESVGLKASTSMSTCRPWVRWGSLPASSSRSSTLTSPMVYSRPPTYTVASMVRAGRMMAFPHRRRPPPRPLRRHPRRSRRGWRHHPAAAVPAGQQRRRWPRQVPPGRRRFLNTRPGLRRRSQSPEWRRFL